MNRRDFCQIVGGAAALAAAPPVFSALAPSNSSRHNPLWKLAVGLNGFESGERKYQKRYPIWEVLEFANAEGFDGVELVGNWPQGGYPGAGEKERIGALRRLYERYGLTVFSIQLSAEGAFAPDTAARRRWLEEFNDRVRFAAQLGCAHVGLWPGGGLRGQTIDAAIDRLCESFRDAVRVAGEVSIVPAFEIEPPLAFNTAEHLRRIQTGSGMKFIYDPSHFDLFHASQGRPHELLQSLGVKNLGYVQLTDTDGTLRDGGTSKHVAVGDGHAQVAESLRIMRDGGFRGWIMVDEWEVPDPYDACRKAKRAMDQAAR